MSEPRVDSPKCPFCAKKKTEAQTYKVAGKPVFKCQVCKHLFRADEFEESAFRWKESHAA